MTLVALVHATPASMGPALDELAARFPDARLWNLLDDRLISEAEAAGGLTPQLRERMSQLIAYAVRGGADAVQLTCSMYGPVTDADFGVPVLSSDGALFAEVARHRPGTIAVLAPTRPGLADSIARLAAVAPDARISGTLVSKSTTVEAARNATADVVVLGQFSLAPLHDAVQAAVTVPVLSAPGPAVDKLKRLVTS